MKVSSRTREEAEFRVLHAPDLSLAPLPQSQFAAPSYSPFTADMHHYIDLRSSSKQAVYDIDPQVFLKAKIIVLSTTSVRVRETTTGS